MKKYAQIQSESGFTLLEILIVVALLGIIATIAVPGLRAWKMNSDANADMRRLYGFFQRARLEAVKQNATSVVTFGQVDENGTTFDFFVFIDSNGNSVYDPAPPINERALVAGNLAPSVTVPVNTFTANAAGLDTATYSGRGLIGRADGAQFLGASVTLQSGAGVSHRLIFNQHGRMRIQ